MSREFRMPALGADMEDGTLVEWRVKPGAQVHKGDVVALVETVKGIIDIECFEDGVVERLVVEPGTLVPVGTTLAWLEGAPSQGEGPTAPLLGATAPSLAGEPAAQLPGAAASAQTGEPRIPPPGEAAASQTGGGRPVAAAPSHDREALAVPVPEAVPQRPSETRAAGHARRISPAARVRAVALHVDPDTVHGTGPGGVITLQDVERAAAAPAPAPALAPAAAPAVGSVSTHAPAPSLPSGSAATLAPNTAAASTTAQAGMRNAIAAAMSRSKREIPHYYLQLSLDLQPAVSWLEAFNAVRPVPERLLMPVLLIKAVARAAAEKPGFSGYFGPKGFEPSPAAHIGVAIALRGGGLVAPALFEADRKPLPILMRELQDLVGRVRAGHMRSSELSSATLTVTSLGEDGADVVYPIIYPPQVAIVGFGAVLERPWVVEGRVEARPVLNLTLAADHRVTDGRQGAQFLARIRSWLSRPGEL